MKTCSKCGVEKPLTEYYPKVKGGKTLRHICKQCQTAGTKISSYKSRHGITQSMVLELANEQGGCAICGKTVDKWHIDHEHSCLNCSSRRGSCDSCRRGILCGNCNTAIGLLGDDVSILESAVKYLAFWKKEHGKEL